MTGISHLTECPVAAFAAEGCFVGSAPLNSVDLLIVAGLLAVALVLVAGGALGWAAARRHQARELARHARAGYAVLGERTYRMIDISDSVREKD